MEDIWRVWGPTAEDFRPLAELYPPQDTVQMLSEATQNKRDPPTEHLPRKTEFGGAWIGGARSLLGVPQYFCKNIVIQTGRVWPTNGCMYNFQPRRGHTFEKISDRNGKFRSVLFQRTALLQSLCHDEFSFNRMRLFCLQLEASCLQWSFFTYN